MITADFTIIPIGTQDTGCKEYIKTAVEVIKDSGLNFQLTAMGTQIEADNLRELYDVISKAQEAVFEAGTGRVYSVIKIDDRRDMKKRSLNDKIESVEKILK